jgi:hypothetical protein
MKKPSIHLLLAMCLALLAGCSTSDTGSARFAVSVPQALSASISRVSITSSAADSASVSVDLVFSNGVWGGFLGHIPAGAHRSFLARAFDASGTRLFEGSASGVTISANQTALVAITLQQLDTPPPFLLAAPVIDSLVASSASSSAGGALSLVATAHDPNPGDTLSYAWSSTAGAFSSASEASTSWSAPASVGIQTLTLTVTDPGGLSSTVSLAIYVTPRPVQGDARFSISFNGTPQVTALGAAPTRLAVGQTTSVSASASDPDGDSLSYSWSASCVGTWTQASSSSASFTPSELPAGACNNCRLTVSVSDGRGGQNTGTMALCVSNTPAINHLEPVILSASGSSLTAAPGQVLTFSVEASDPEGSALSFSWTANTGSSGTPVHGASSSSLTWTAPFCVRESIPPHLTATVTNAFNQRATQRFAVTGLPVCPPPSWASTGSLASPRNRHTATLLPNGKVLVSGGSNDSGPLATAELYDPASGTWSTTASMASPRFFHTATLLNNGKVLVSGGHHNSGPVATAEVFDPASGIWSTTASMASPRFFHTATLLNNGKVLISGGLGPQGPLATAEVYDPTSGTWSVTDSMTTPRYWHTATLLNNGQVLVSGGNDFRGGVAAAEAYDPASSTWSAAGSMASPRFSHTATRLHDGRVLISGGQTNSPTTATTAELYDPASSTWSATGFMASPRDRHTATLLPDGRVLIAGGAAAEEYDPALGTWSAAGSMASPHSEHTATLLPNGKVLISGGDTAELYTP